MGASPRRLAAWLDQKVGPRAAPVRHQLWEPAVLEQWAAALRTPSMQLAHLECTGPHALGTEFLRHVIEESIRAWYAHAKARATLLKARLGPGSTMAWTHTRYRSCAYTSKRSGRECSGSSWNKDGRQGRADQVFPTPPLSTEAYTHTHGAHTTHTAPPVYLYPWVDIPAIAFW